MDTTTRTKDLMAGQIAETVLDDLRATITDRKFRGRVWIASDHARVYTGAGDEHLRVTRDGKIERSRSRMTWGGQIDEVLAADAGR